MIERRLLSNYVVKTLGYTKTPEGVDIPVGFVDKPTGGGWQGQPNKDGSNYIPYAVVIPGRLIPQRPQGGLAGPQTEWLAPYRVSLYSRLPDGVEWLADLLRAGADTMKSKTIEIGDTYRIQDVRIEGVGSIVRYDEIKPETWGQVDEFVLWLSKE